MGMILLLARAALAECPSVDEALDRATTTMVAGDDASAVLAEAEARLACTTVNRALLARLWLAHGAARQFAGDRAGAEVFYASARAADPDVFDERLGGEVRAAWSAATLAGTATLTVDQPAYVDGRMVRRFPKGLDAGPHAVQSSGRDWAKVVVLPPGDELQVTIPEMRGTAEAATPRKHSAAFLVASGVLLAGAGGCAWGATMQDDAMAEAGSTAALDEAYGMQSTLAWSALGLGVAGVGVGALYFVF